MLKQTIAAALVATFTTGAMAQETGEIDYYAFTGNDLNEQHEPIGRHDKGVYRIDNGRYFELDTFVACRRISNADGSVTTQFQEADAGAWYNAANAENKSCIELNDEIAEQLAERVDAVNNRGVSFADWVDDVDQGGTPARVYPPELTIFTPKKK